MIHHLDIQVRFSDTDALGHLNNVAYAAYAEAGRVEFLRRLGKSVKSLILASVSIDFRRQVNFGDPVHIDTWIAAFGRTSITLGQSISAKGEIAANVKSVVVHFDYTTNKPIPLTDAIRAELEPYLVPTS